MAKVTEYRAVVTRGQRYWLVEIPELGQVTQARRLTEAEPMAIDLIASVLGKRAKSITVTLDIELPRIARRHLELAAKKTAQASRLQNEAALERRAAARALRDSRMSYTDIGIALGISYQRARQLVLEDPNSPTT